MLARLGENCSHRGPLLLRVVASIPSPRDDSELQQWSDPLSDLSGKKEPRPALALSHVFLIARRTTTRSSRREQLSQHPALLLQSIQMLNSPLRVLTRHLGSREDTGRG